MLTIGGATIADGQIFRGHAAAGQLGHTTVNLAGKPCKCGGQCYLETACSGTGLRRLLADAGFAEETSINDVLQLQTPEVTALVMAWATALHAGIDSLVAAFGPEIVLLGGGLGAAEAGDAVARLRCFLLKQ